MQNRNVALCIVLTVITCGIYGIYWFIKLTDEMIIATGESDTSGGMAFLFSIITCSIYRYFWSYKMGNKLNLLKERNNFPPESSLSIIFLVLSICGLDIVAWALIQDSMNKLYPENA